MNKNSNLEFSKWYLQLLQESLGTKIPSLVLLSADQVLFRHKKAFTFSQILPLATPANRGNIYHQNLLKLQLWIMNRAIHPWGELSCARSTLIRLKIYHRQYYAFNQRCRICECYWYNPYFSQNGWRLLHQKMPEMVAPFFTRSSSSKWAPRAPRAWTSAVRLLNLYLQ